MEYPLRFLQLKISGRVSEKNELRSVVQGMSSLKTYENVSITCLFRKSKYLVRSSMFLNDLDEAKYFFVTCVMKLYQAMYKFNEASWKDNI